MENLIVKHKQQTWTSLLAIQTFKKFLIKEKEKKAVSDMQTDGVLYYSLK